MIERILSEILALDIRGLKEATNFISSDCIEKARIRKKIQNNKLEKKKKKKKSDKKDKRGRIKEKDNELMNKMTTASAVNQIMI